jgi:hypothetical protein
MRRHPVVFGITSAIAFLLNNVQLDAVRRQVVVVASRLAIRTDGTSEPVNTLMIGWVARTTVKSRASCVRQPSEIIVERMVLLRQNNDVVDALESTNGR